MVAAVASAGSGGPGAAAEARWRAVPCLVVAALDFHNLAALVAHAAGVCDAPRPWGAD
jgi:hypothetical protein